MLHILKARRHIRDTPQTRHEANEQRPQMRHVTHDMLRARDFARAAQRALDWRRVLPQRCERRGAPVGWGVV